MLRAMPAILKEFPNFVYIVLGATHPNLIREQGERYRISLERLAKDLGIKPNVSFYNRFVEIDELIEFIGMADIYITPYLNPAQITSGTLAYSFGCGKAVVSTPYWYAEELLADGRGVLVPFGDSEALAREICELLRDEPRRHAMRKKAYMLGREMIWSHVAHLYMESFQRARRSRLDMPYKPLAVRTLAEQPMDLPGWRLDHLVRMTDSAGMLQHANSTIPNFAEGYCTDDNARALLLTVLLEQLGQSSAQVHRLATTYAAFLNYAFDRDAEPVPQFPGLRPPLARGGRLGRLPRPGALGAGGLRRPVAAARPAVLGLAALRPGAADDHRDDLAAGLGLRLDRRLPVPPALQRRPAGQPGARHPDRAADRAASTRPRPTTGPGSRTVLSYDNAKLPHALIASGRSGGEPAGDSTWACKPCAGWSTSRSRRPGYFRPIGSNGFYHRERRAGPVRPAADRGQRDGLGLHRGLPCHRRPRLAPGGPAGVRVVPGRQRPGARSLRRQDRRLLRRPAGRPRQPEPGGRVDPGVPARRWAR